MEHGDLGHLNCDREQKCKMWPKTNKYKERGIMQSITQTFAKVKVYLRR